jgi:hypothetical protein
VTDSAESASTDAQPVQLTDVTLENTNMEEILKAILEGNRQSAGQGQSQADPLADLIGSIIGGGGKASAQPASGQDMIGDLIGGLIGGSPNAPKGNGQILDLIGAIMGGTGRSGQASSANPIAKLLADKTGLPVELAQMVVAFFMSKLLSGATRQPASGADSYKSGGQERGTVDLDDLLEVMDDDKALNNRLGLSQMPQELAAQTGMSQQQASDSLQALVKLVGQRRDTPQPSVPVQTDLKDLLDTWK